MNKRAKIILLRTGLYTLLFPFVAAMIFMATVAYTIKTVDYVAEGDKPKSNSPDSEMCFVTPRMTPYIVFDLLKGEAPYMKLMAPSGDYRIDSLIKEYTLLDTFGARKFSDNKLFYRFYGRDGVSDSYKEGVRAALKEWEKVANIKFNELKGDERCKYYAHIEFRQHALDNHFCTKMMGSEKCNPHTRMPVMPFIQPAVVSMPENYTDYTPGTFSKTALLHEIGHALGLQHPRYYANGGGLPNKNKKGLPEKEDKIEHTVMSYSSPEGYEFPSKPMVYDVMAIQYLYGAPATQTAQPATEFIPIR